MIREHATEKPFFLYLAFNAPHWPLQARPAEIAKQKGRYDAGWDVIRARRFERMKKLGIVDERWVLSEREGKTQHGNTRSRGPSPRARA